MNSHTIFGLVSLFLTVWAYKVYLHDTFKRGVRPHILTWIAFGILTAVGSVVQLREGAGPGGWALGLTSLSCFVISGSSLWKQIQDRENWWRFPKIDLLWFVISLIILGFYLRFPTHPTTAAILATCADLSAYGPTLNQAWHHPYRESVKAFSLNSAKFAPALLALRSLSLATALYPSALLVMNAFVAGLLTYRQRLIKKQAIFSKGSGG